MRYDPRKPALGAVARAYAPARITDWADELVADTPAVATNPHYHCATLDPQPCPTGEHINPASSAVGEDLAEQDCEDTP